VATFTDVRRAGELNGGRQVATLTG
jgi:hypothetical protein